MPKQCGRLSSADDEAFQLSSAQLNRELRTQVSNTFKSASLISTVTNEQYHFVSSSDRFPVPDVCSLRINYIVSCVERFRLCRQNVAHLVFCCIICQCWKSIFISLIIFSLLQLRLTRVLFLAIQGGPKLYIFVVQY